MLSQNSNISKDSNEDLLDLVNADIMKSSSRHSIESIGSDPDNLFDELKKKAEEE